MRSLSRCMRLGVVLAGVAVAALVQPAATADPRQFAGYPDEPAHRAIAFPVEGSASYSDTWHAPRSGGRLHLGQDLFAPKLRPVVAVVDGVVSWLRVEEEGVRSGRMLTLRDRQGWTYRYIHLNNDRPGTDDGAAPRELTLVPGIDIGVRVKRGQRIGYLGDSGNAEGTPPHLHFEILTPDGRQINPYPSLQLSQGKRYANLCRFSRNPEGRPSAASGAYYVADRAGGVFAFGGTRYHGSVPGLRAAGQRIGRAEVVGMVPSDAGYWLFDDQGGVFTFGDARFFGSVPGLRAAGQRIGQATVVDAEATPSGAGYWMADDQGGVFTFGDARFFGSVPGLRAAGQRIGPATVVAMTATPSGAGYWMLDDQGGVFTFGDARFFGSVPGLRAAGQRIGHSEFVAMAATPSGRGYWLVDRQGGVFTFGDASYFGSVPGVGLCRWSPVASFGVTATGNGYWMVSEDGRVWAFGDARYLGGVDRIAGAGRAGAIDLRPA